MAFLEASNLHKTYRLSRHNIVRALRGVDMSVEAGGMVGIMGPSGCGKSTLMHILGLLHSPDGGTNPPPSLLIDGIDVASLTDTERTHIRAKRMGFVFQAFNLLSTLTALENVALPAEYASWHKSAATEAAARCHCSGPCHETRAASGGRTHGQPGFGEHGTGYGAPAPVQPRTWADDCAGDPRYKSQQNVRSHSYHARRGHNGKQPSEEGLRHLIGDSCTAATLPWSRDS